MLATESELLGILRIARDASFRGKEELINQAMSLAGYDRLRSQLGPADLVPLLQANPELLGEWILFCGVDAQLAGATRWLGSKEAAVAEFIVWELQCWHNTALQAEAWRAWLQKKR